MYGVFFHVNDENYANILHEEREVLCKQRHSLTNYCQNEAIRDIYNFIITERQLY